MIRSCARILSLAALIGAAPASAHGGEALFCMPFVWLLELYTKCVIGGVQCASLCCGPSQPGKPPDDRVEVPPPPTEAPDPPEPESDAQEKQP